jgi:hypothetical protein
MKHTLSLLLCACVFGCGSSDPIASTPSDASTTPDARSNILVSSADAGEYEFPCFNLPPPTHQPTFLGVYREVFCVAGCANLYCHSSRGASGGLNLEAPKTAYESLVGAKPGAQAATDVPGCSMSKLLRVEPGHPERSLLYLKVSQKSPPCGARMPLERDPLSPMQLTQLKTWIENGARDDRDDSQPAADAGRD